MATVFQPPFWVPRPYDGPVWKGTAPPQSLILPLLTSVGQTKPRWPWHFELNDPPPWSGSPLASDVLAVLLTVGGKIKPRLPWQFGLDAPDPWKWNPPNLALTEAIISRPFVNPPLNFWRDDAPIWSGAPIDSSVLGQLLTAQGQTKPRWPWNFGYDDPAIWSGEPIKSEMLGQLPTAGQTKPRWPWHFELHESPCWQGKPLASDLLGPLLTPEDPQKSRWMCDVALDAPSPWSGSPIDSAVLIISQVTPAGQVKPRWPWHFEQNDAAFWQGKPVARNLLTPLLTPQDPMKIRWMWDFDLDVPSPWSGSPIDSAVLGQLLTGQGQTKPRWPWHFELDDPPVWLGSPVASGVLETQADAGESSFWVPRPYDVPVWSWLPPDLALTKAAPVVAPSFNPPWLFGRDDAPVWSGSPLHSALLGQLLTAQGQTKPRIPWNWGQNDPPHWYGQILPNQERNTLLLTTVIGTPFLNPPWIFGQDHQSVFWGSPLPVYRVNLSLANPGPPVAAIGNEWLIRARRRGRR